MEHKIIKAAIESKEYYDQITAAITKEKDLSEIGQIVFDFIAHYYAVDKSASQVDITIILERLNKKYEKKAELFSQYFALLPSDVSFPNLVEDIVALKKGQLKNEIIVALSSGRSDADKLMEKYLSFSLESPSLINGDVFTAVPISELLESVKKDNLIPIYPTALNEALGGGIPRESQVLVYGRPDSGKSTFVINWAGGLLLKGYKVLYIGNEDPPSILMLRILARMLGVPKEVIASDPTTYEKKAHDLGYSNLIFASLHPGTLKDIRSLVSSESPDLVIVDQLRNLKVSKDGTVVNYEEAAKGCRNIAKEFGVVMASVTQAGDSASNRAVLDMGDVDGSNTGIPGAMDLMIGIGQTQEMKANNNLILSTPKNKLSAPVKPLTCKVDYMLNKVLSMG